MTNLLSFGPERPHLRPSRILMRAIFRQPAVNVFVIVLAGSLAWFFAAVGWAQEAPLKPSTQDLLLPALHGAVPWSAAPVLNDPQRFHIAIMSDHTGGHRPGIWMQAVKNLNLMRPEFVLSVGDLIEGYSEDEAVIQAQWKEFVGFIDQLQMRFFFVAGNHDLSNPVMHRLWRERFGPEWYSFDYRGVHFLCLSSEDPVTRIGDKQLVWIEQDLEKHQEARWTLVFLHKPLWTYAERAEAAGVADPTNWKKVEKLLADRPHTVFAGHEHRYIQFDRQGRKFYQLATTGGGSLLRGKKYGEFDHFVWLTMEADGPRIANLTLDGVLAPDVVTEQGIVQFRQFLNQVQLQIDPILVPALANLETGQIKLRLKNGYHQDVELAGRIDGLPWRGLTVEPVELQGTIPAGETRDHTVTFRLTEGLPAERFAMTLFKGSLRVLNEPSLAVQIEQPVTIDREFDVPKKSIQLDGDLADWGTLDQVLSSKPLLLGNVTDWTGPSDATFRFALAYDDQQLYYAASVRDDHVVPMGDALYLTLDTRPFDRRLADSRLGVGTIGLEVSIPAKDGMAPVTVQHVGPNKPAAQASVRRTPDGYQLELALALSAVTALQGPKWTDLMATTGLRDRDGDTECYVIWRGSQEILERNTHFAHFFRRNPVKAE